MDAPLGNLPTQIYGHGQLTTLFLYGPILSKDHVPVCNLARDLAIGATEELYERNLLDIPSMKVGHYCVFQTIWNVFELLQFLN